MGRAQNPLFVDWNNAKRRPKRVGKEGRKAGKLRAWSGSRYSSLAACRQVTTVSSDSGPAKIFTDKDLEFVARIEDQLGVFSLDAGQFCRM